MLRDTWIYRGRTPSWEELRQVKVNEKRILLVIRLRWLSLVLLAAYGVYLAVFYGLQEEILLTREQIQIPASALVIVAAYNGWYQLTYRSWSRIRVTNLLQLVVDLLVVTILIQYSGGVHSWFWAMYVLLTLQACFLLETRREVFAVGALGALCYGALLTANYYDLLPAVVMPFEDAALQHTFTYEMITWGWVAVINAAVALIGTHLVGLLRARETELQRLVVRDPLTDLFNRLHFFRRLRGEMRRARRYEHDLSLLMIDVDDFKSYNDDFGHVEGDTLLRCVAEIMGSEIRRSTIEPEFDLDVPCRYGGEEFAIILPETDVRGATNVAERIREAIADNPIRRRVTVSIGIASYPDHAATSDELIRRADEALYRAKGDGKNRVETSVGGAEPPLSDPPPPLSDG